MLTSSELNHISTTTPPRRIGQGKGGGRKGSITPEKAAILLAALENGLTVKESLQQAELSQDAYDRRLQKDGKFRGQVAVAKKSCKSWQRQEWHGEYRAEMVL